MKNKIEVLGVEIDHYTAKEAMEKAMEYMQTEPIHVIELVTMNTLIQFLRTEQKFSFDEFDMMLAGNRTILEAAGVTDAKYLKEIENNLFVKMLLQFWHKNRTRVFLLSEDETSLKDLREYLQTKYPGIVIADGASMEEKQESDDMLINKVNGAEAECIIAEIDALEQKEFIVRNRALLNVKVWLGLTAEFRDKWQKVSIKHRLKYFLNLQLLKKVIQKEHEKGK